MAVKVKYLGNYTFLAEDENGNCLQMDLGAKFGGEQSQGWSARELLLAALVGCSGSSFVQNLAAQGVDTSSIEIRVEGKVSETPPRIYRHIQVTYQIGEGVPEEIARESLTACSTDGCSVHATLSHVAEIKNNLERH